MNELKVKIKSLLKGIDSFGEPILLSYRGKTNYKSWFGGALTIIGLGLIIIFSYEAIVSLILRENMKVAFTEIYEQDPFPIRLMGQNGFHLAMGLQPDALNNQTKRHFEIKVNQRINKRYKNGTLEKIYVPISIL